MEFPTENKKKKLCNYVLARARENNLNKTQIEITEESAARKEKSLAYIYNMNEARKSESVKFS